MGLYKISPKKLLIQHVSCKVLSACFGVMVQYKHTR